MQASRDENRIPTLLGVSSTDGTTPVTVYVDPDTHRLLVDLPSSSGDVTGPASSTDNAVARYDSTTGKIIQNSLVTIDDTGVINSEALTASEILATDGSKNIVSLPVATYPSLTELSYVKGVTSAIQSQINAKADALSGTINEIAYFDSATTIASLDTATYPSILELSYVKGAQSNLQTQIDALSGAIVLKGTWDASTGSFPGGGSAQSGWSYIVSTGGTVDGVEFTQNDRIVAITDNASTSTYSGNWFKLDYTDQVLSVFGRTGAVTATDGDYSQSLITGLKTSDSPQFAGVNVGHASDTTVGRGAAGFIDVEGKRVPSPASQAEGDILYRGSTEWERLAKGTADQVLTMNSGATAPEWQDASGGGGFTPSITTGFSILESTTAFSKSTSGSGSASLSSNRLRLETGTTGDSLSNALLGFPGDVDLFSDGVSVNTTIRIFPPTNGSGFVGIGEVSNISTGGAITQDHIGFKVVVSSGTATLYATQASGGTESQTSLTTVASNQTISLAFVIDGSSVNYYYRIANGAWSTVTTISTNIPSSDEKYYFSGAVDGNAASNNVVMDIFNYEYKY